MKKRTLFLAMTALMITMTSGGSLTAVYADEIPTEAAETSESTELPIKPLTAKIVDENPYMAKSDSNIHHDCYNTDSTDEVLPVSPVMTIYSIVNSLCELSNVSKVHISVKGSSNILFRDSIDLSQPLERSLDIIELQ